jgi:predicted transcriptional regulator
MEMTTEIVSAFVGNSDVPTDIVPEVIISVHRALREVTSAEHSPNTQIPAVPIKKSIQPDHLVCLEDGRKLKLLKRHLRTAYGMTPDEYREKWRLPRDYPMIAPAYAAQRSLMAKEFGLGRKPRKRVRKKG